MSEILLRDSFLDINPKSDIQAYGLELLGIDVENVLTDYSDPEVLPGIAEHLEELQVAGDGLQVVLITNKRSDGFLDEVVSQLPGYPPFINPSKEAGLKKKPSPDMFRHVLTEMFPDVDPAHAAHVDDQLKAYFGASKAGFEFFIWTKPVGEHQHKGVKALRPLEFGLVRPFVNARINFDEIIRGDW